MEALMVHQHAWLLISPELQAQLLYSAGLPDVAAGGMRQQRHWCFNMAEFKLRRREDLLAVDPAGAAQLAVDGQFLHLLGRRL